MIYAFLSLVFGSAEMIYLDYSFRYHDPVVFMAFFYACAFLTMLIIFKFKKNKINQSEISENKHNLAYYILLGAIGNALWFSSLYLIGSGGIVLVSIIQRIYLLYYSTKKMNEKMTIIQYIASIIVIISTIAFSTETENKEFLGVMLCVISYVLFALSDIAQKRVADKVNWDTALLIRQFVQFIIFNSLLGIYLLYSNVSLAREVSMELLGAALLASLMGAVIGKAAHYLALKEMSLSRVTLIEQLKVLVVFLSSVLIMEQFVSTVQIVAGILMIASILLINYEDYTKKEKMVSK